MTDLISVLMEMRSGRVAQDLSEKFREVLQAVLDTGGKGELSIKLMIKPSKFAMGGAVIEIETKHEAKMKKPELAVGSAVFFVTQDGDLTRDDPAQVALFSEEAARKENNARTR